MKTFKIIIPYCVCFVFLLSASCKKFVEIGIPKSQTTTAAVYNSDVTAVSAISGIYSEILNSGKFIGGGDGSVGMLAGLSADEFIGYGASQGTLFQQNNLLSTTGTVKTALWEPAYRYIYYANSAIEGLSKSTGVTDSVKKELTAEAKFIRAFCYFYLVNLFGEVPLAVSTDYTLNNILSRSSVDAVYEQILKDIIDAKDNLPGNYGSLNAERTRPTQWAATALLARVYLYRGDWIKAEQQSSALIESGLFELQTDISDVFSNTSKETIWQMKPVQPGKNTNEAGIYIVTGDVFPFYVSLTDELLNSFHPDDLRKLQWVGNITNSEGTFHFPYKYKIVEQGQPLTEYSIVFRLAEQYLIRAEARARQGLLDDAIADLDMIRDRADIPLIHDTDPGIGQDELLNVVAHEREVELFSEWGHRWFDLKRTNKADAVLAPIKSINWQPTDILYPIPQSERDNNFNLSQNLGYL